MFYWRVYVPSTGEIMEQGNAPTVKRAEHMARALIEHYLWYLEPGEQFKVEIREGERTPENWDIDGDVISTFKYQRHERGS